MVESCGMHHSTEWLRAGRHTAAERGVLSMPRGGHFDSPSTVPFNSDMIQSVLVGPTILALIQFYLCGLRRST